jgi:hypothetical protein
VICTLTDIAAAAAGKAGTVVSAGADVRDDS